MKLSDLKPRVVRLLGVEPVESERDLQRKRNWYAKNRDEQRRKARARWEKRNARKASRAGPASGEKEAR